MRSKLVAVTFPSLWLLSRTTVYPTARTVGAGSALVLATAWTVDRLGILSNPLSAVEDAAVDNLGALGVGLAIIAGLAWLFASFGDGTFVRRKVWKIHEPISHSIRSVVHE